MAANPHAEVERVIRDAFRETIHDRVEAVVLLLVRHALRDGRLTPERVGAAVGLRAEVTPSGVCVSRGRCLCVPRLAEDSDAS